MDGSNSDNLSQPHPIINDGWDFSNWDVDPTMWNLFHEDDQIHDDFFLITNPSSAQCPGFDHATDSLNVAGQAEQNMSLNEWEIIAPESFDIAEMLTKDPDLDPFSTTHDLPLEPPVIVLPFEPFTPDGFEWTLEQAPPPPTSDPSPDEVPLVVPSWLDGQGTTYDFYHPNQADQKPADSSNVSEKDIRFEIGQSLVGGALATSQGPQGSQVYPQGSMRTSRSPEPSRCAPCRFANIPMSQCNGSVGSTCTRCERLRSKVDENLANIQSSLRFSISPSESTIPLPQVIYFELLETQKLLVALRGEVNEISSFTPGNSLETLFDGNMLWHIDDKAIFSPYSKSLSTIAVTRLVTARAETASQPNCIAAPAMDAVHLDTFIDQRRPARETKGLTDINRETLTIAWRCAYWLTILLSWDSNEIYVNQAGRDVLPLVDAKNLVLELTYSIAHRIQVLIKKLCHRAAKSLNRLDESLDPGTICCGLWIVFSATHKFEKQNFRAKSLKSLRRFLSNLHERSRAAFHSLDHYKRLMWTSCCSLPRHNDALFSKFIADAKKPKATITFAAERHVSDPFFMKGEGLFDSGLQPQSFSDILESEISFQDDTDLFLGRPARRNLAALRPSDRVSLALDEIARAQGSTSTSTTEPLTFSNLSKLSSASSIDSAQLNGFESRKRHLSGDGTSFSLSNAKRIK